MKQVEPRQIALEGLAGEQRQIGPVECLRLSFESDEARRAHFLERLRERLTDPAFRAIEGFPIGTDEDILRLSDPPYYTACPNPFLEDFILHYGRPYDPDEVYSREPYAVDSSEGKTDPIYTAHSYHTKVPHKAIMRAILHYTNPGDLVLDGFAGTGMTGVAAQMCGAPESEFRQLVEQEWKASGAGTPAWGARRALLNDLGPAATFISANYNLPFDVAAFQREARRILQEVDSELGWMYETRHTDGTTIGRIEYTVWSEVFTCPNCTGEIVFYREALDQDTKEVHEEFPCPHCHMPVTKRKLDRITEQRVDPVVGGIVTTPKRVPVLIVYDVAGHRVEKAPDQGDLDLLARIAQMPLPAVVPVGEIPYMHMTHERARLSNAGITHLHHFFLPRASHALAALWQKVSAISDVRLRNMLFFYVEQAIWGMSVLARYVPTHFSQVNQYLTGVYYVGSQHAECSPWYILEGKLHRLGKAFTKQYAQRNGAAIITGTAARLQIPSASIDYIFTDPPFGENIYYADLNFLVESWHRVWTNAGPEAIVDQAKKKELTDYQRLMQQCFEEYARVLKPGRWMTVVFHNSRNAVWNAIQEAMSAAGFVVADVRTLDKQQGSYRQVTSTAVKQDLVISAYKPDKAVEERFVHAGGTEAGVWEVVRGHLRQLPVFVGKDGRCEVIATRLPHRLFDSMVAFHVQRGRLVPLSVSDFIAGLEQRFAMRDDMYFLPEQVAEYDKKRMSAKEIAQLQLFVTNEESSILWLRQQLLKKPQTIQDLRPQFMKELAGWPRHEKPLELSELLEESFLCYNSTGPVPNQIHDYLSDNYHDMRGLPKDDPSLQARAKDRWYVPDPNKAGDLEKLREKALLKEFALYQASTARKLREFRLEAVRAGFKKAWQDRDYATILAVAAKIPEDILQEDQKLIMWYDQALTRSGGES